MAFCSDDDVILSRTGNFHKWMFCPKGTAFLWVAPAHQPSAQGVLISHYWRESFWKRFQMQGTLNDTAFLTVPTALKFVHTVAGGVESMRKENHEMVCWAANMLCERWSTELLVPLEKCTTMAVILCPLTMKTEDENFFDLVWDQFKIIVPIIRMPGMCGVWARISANLYNQRSDYERLADAVLQLKDERVLTSR